MDQKQKPEKCLGNHKWAEVWEDHILMGNIFYGYECAVCGRFRPSEVAPLELGIYK